MPTSPSRAAVRGKVAAKAKSPPGENDEPVSVAAVVERIRERIRRGRLVPGQRLVEADLMRELSASRGRVREALQRLSTEGLVTIEEFRGASVKQFSRDEIRQIYRARMALEGLAARDFADAAAPDLKRRLARLQDELNSLESTGDHERFARLFKRLHVPDVQFIPAQVEANSGPYFILNTLLTIRCIDDARCAEVEYWQPEDEQPEKIGQYRSIYDLRIDPAKVGHARVFRTWGWSIALIISEDLKQAIESEGLTGTRFVEV